MTPTDFKALATNSEQKNVLSEETNYFPLSLTSSNFSESCLIKIAVGAIS